MLCPSCGLRRSKRLEALQQPNRADCAPAAVVMTTAPPPHVPPSALGPLGALELIPLELKFMIFTYLSVEDLSSLTITSKAVRNLVEIYRNTEPGRRNILRLPLPPHSTATLPPEEHKHYLKQFSKCGLLLKRSTCLYATKDRLKLVLFFLQKYLCRFHDACADKSGCLALTCAGRLLHTVIAGWDDKECVRTYDAVVENTRTLKQLQCLVEHATGSSPEKELSIRQFFRRVFLDQCDAEKERAFWLNLILKPFVLVQQARILYVLFGPVDEDGVKWSELCDETPATKQQSIATFANLAGAFHVLHRHSADWSEDAVLSVIDELMSYPRQWMLENVAGLLFHCGDAITLKVLTSKAINGRCLELASIITALSLVCRSQQTPQSWVVGVLMRLCHNMDNPRDKLSVLLAIPDMYSDLLLDFFYELSDAAMPAHDDQNGDKMDEMVTAQAEFTKELLKLVFKYVLGGGAIGCATVTTVTSPSHTY